MFRIVKRHPGQPASTSRNSARAGHHTARIVGTSKSFPSKVHQITASVPMMRQSTIQQQQEPVRLSLLGNKAKAHKRGRNSERNLPPPADLDAFSF